MSKVVFDISVSLDGFIAPPNHDPSRLQAWLFNGDTPSKYSDFFTLSAESAQVFDELLKTTGAIITGRRTYDLTGGWGGSHPVSEKVFVLSRDIPQDIPQGSTTFTFVLDGVESAVRQAKKAAGDKNVYLMGGANVAQQCLNAGLLDEITLHVVPVLLGQGVRLFDNLEHDTIELEQTKVVQAPGVTHLGFRFIRSQSDD
ncbi:MAG: dihydrofolate reductase family protein [bacterium]|nr:dihydrofolate reductase family protein [bacterium]